MTLTRRPDLASLPTYVPGESPTGAGDALKLSSNELPFPPHPVVLEAIAAAAAELNRYPAVDGAGLAAAIAAHLDLEPARVAVGGGSVALLQQLVQAFVAPGEAMLFGWRSYEAYPIIAAVAGARAVTVPLVEDRYDVEGLLRQVDGDARLLILCNPNNPTGTTVDEATVEHLLDRLPDRCLVVLDEAYREFVTDPGVPDGLALQQRYPNVAVLRTFSKAHALAGIRVGYCVAAAEVVAAVRSVSLPFPVSRLAEAAARAALSVAGPAAERVRQVVALREALRDRLLELGFPVPVSQGNFLWLPLGAQTARFAAACRSAGITVRPFGGEGVRVTVGLEPANDAFLAVAAAYLADSGSG